MKKIVQGTYFWAVCLCVLLPVIAWGGPPQSEALAFNQALVSSNKKLQEAGTTMGRALVPAIQGSAGAQDKLNTEYANLKKVVSKVKAEVAALKVPSDSSSKALYQAHQKYLNGQESMVNNEMGQVVKIAGDKKLSKSEKSKKVQALLATVQKRENQDLAGVQSAQKAFAKEHHITLLPGG